MLTQFWTNLVLEMSTKIFSDCDFDFHDNWHRENHVLLTGVNEFTLTCVPWNIDILKIKTDCKVCVLHHGVRNLQSQCQTHVVFMAIACYFAGVSPLRNTVTTAQQSLLQVEPGYDLAPSWWGAPCHCLVLTLQPCMSLGSTHTQMYVITIKYYHSSISKQNRWRTSVQLSSCRTDHLKPTITNRFNCTLVLKFGKIKPNIWLFAC